MGDPKRYQNLQWIHAAEATYALHAISILYARWNQHEGDVAKTEERMSKNVINDFNYLESEIKKNNGKFLFGDKVTAADTMVHFSVAFILARELGTQGKSWPAVEEFRKACEATDTYKKAVEKTGHKL